MAAWRKEEVDAARQRQEKRDWGKSCHRTRKRKTSEAERVGLLLVDEPTEYCTSGGIRRHQTCVAPFNRQRLLSVVGKY